MASRLGDSLKFGVLPELDGAAVKRIKSSVDEMTRNRDIKVRVNGAQLNAELKKYQLELAKLSGDKEVKLKARADLASAKLAAAEIKAVTDKAGNDSGTSAGKKFTSAFGKSLGGFKGIASLGGNIASTGLSMGKTLGVNILKGAALALAVKAALTLTAALPAAFGATGILAGAALGVGIVTAATKALSSAKQKLSTLAQTIALEPKGATASQQVQEKQLKQEIKTLQQFQALANKASETWHKVQLAIFNAVKPLLGPMIQALNDVQKQLPAIQRMFSQTFGIVAPLIRPIEQMLFNIVANIMPGFNALLKATAPVFGQFANSIGKVVASNLGNFFKALAPAVKASMPVFTQLLKSISGLLPIIGKVIATVATGLGPVLIKVFGAVWKAVRPLVGVIVSLATSLISDLAPVFKVIATVVHTLAGPLLQVGKALGGLILAAVKALAPAVGKLFGPLSQIVATVLKLAAAIIKALTPVIGPLVGLIGKLANMLASSLAGAVKAILPDLVHLAAIIGSALVQAIKLVTPILVTLFNAGLSELVKILPPVVKLIVQVAGVLLKSLMGALQKILPVFLQLLQKAILPLLPSLGKLVLAFIPLVQAILPLIPPLTQLIVLMVELFAKIDGFVYPILTKLLTNAIIPLVTWIVSHVVPAVKLLANIWLTEAIIIVKAAKFLADGVLNTFGLIIHGAADAFGWLPGIGGKLRGADKAFQDFHKKTDNVFNGIIGTMQKWQKELNSSGDTSKAVTKKISGDFAAQNKAAGNAKLALDKYSAAIKNNGVNSDAARKARAALIADMVAAGVKASTANKDVDSYTRAVKTHSAISDAVRAARTRLINDILAASRNSVTGNKDLSAFTSAVQHHSAKSDQVRSARARLISDLEKSGLNAKTATRLVDGLQGSINKLHSKAITITMSGNGHFSVSAGTLAPGATAKNPPANKRQAGQNLASNLTHRAMGGKIAGFDNRDRVHAMLEGGEAVVPKNLASSPAFSGWAKMHGIPGYASGGVVGNLEPDTPTRWYNQFQARMISSMESAMKTAAAAARAAAMAAIAGGPLGGATGSEMQNGLELYRYLLANLFGGNKIAAAGATASIWGESTWNPFAQGTGGRGLIGWTPPGTISNAAFSGGMRTQLPAIIQFVVRNGDMGAIRQMESARSVSDAAWIWGRRVERFGIPDVHPTGIALASRFMGMARGGMVPVFDRGGTLSPGLNLVNNATGRPEHVTPTNGNTTITLEFTGGSGSELDHLMLAWLRKTVRVRGGGSVERAFGNPRNR